MKSKKRKTIDARKYLTYLVSCFIIPLAFLLMIYSVMAWDSYKSVNTEIAKTGRKTIEMYQVLLEKELAQISLNIADKWANDIDHINILYETDPVTRYYSVNQIRDQYRSLMSSSFCVRGMMLYSEANHIENYLDYEGKYTYEFAQRIHEEMKAIVDSADETTPKGFFPKKIDGRYFLFRIIGYNNCYTVIMIDMDDLAAYQNRDIQQDDGFLYYTTPEGEPFCTNEQVKAEPFPFKDNAEDYFITGGDVQYLVTYSYSEKANLQILYFAPYKSSIPAIKKMQLTLAVVSLIMVLFIPFLYRLLARSFFTPIENLNQSMIRIRNGNLNEKANEDFTISEFQKVNVTFNQMMSEIKDLKIASYEKELQKKQAKLQYLQLQIRPHFFLNCLKILYSMVEQKKYDKVQNMILQISRYFRYRFQDNKLMVTLREELDYVDNYIKMQRESMLQTVFYTANVEEDVLSCPIPVLLLQTFIENSFKYARKQDDTLLLEVTIFRLHVEESDYLDIMITDNGEGFQEEVMQKINSTEQFPCSNNHIGIENIKQRLFLLYGEKAMLQLSNPPCGAQVEIVIPADRK